jgi:hypothetical protein
MAAMASGLYFGDDGEAGGLQRLRQVIHDHGGLPSKPPHGHALVRHDPI